MGGLCLSNGKICHPRVADQSQGCDLVSYASAGVTMWIAQQGAHAASGLATFKTWTDVIGKIITGAAVIIGGIWAYFKFVKGRIFRPRVEIEMSGQWLDVDDKKWLQARIRVKNIGASKISLRQEGSGLRVFVLAADQPTAPAAAVWDRRKTCAILKKHAWIEPGETVSDEILLDLGTPPGPVMFESRLILPRTLFRNISINARQIVPGDAATSAPKGLGRFSQWISVIPGLQGNHQDHSTARQSPSSPKTPKPNTSTKRQKTRRKQETGSPKRTSGEGNG